MIRTRDPVFNDAVPLEAIVLRQLQLDAKLKHLLALLLTAHQADDVKSMAFIVLGATIEDLIEAQLTPYDV